MGSPTWTTGFPGDARAHAMNRNYNLDIDGDKPQWFRFMRLQPPCQKHVPNLKVFKKMNWWYEVDPNRLNLLTSTLNCQIIFKYWFPSVWAQASRLHMVSISGWKTSTNNQDVFGATDLEGFAFFTGCIAASNSSTACFTWSVRSSTSSTCQFCWWIHNVDLWCRHSWEI